ncbi:MAG: matrixin family metalloprotease [Fimbriimonadaceae bacterium]
MSQIEKHLRLARLAGIGGLLICLGACGQGPSSEATLVDEHVGKRKFPLGWRVGRIDQQFKLTPTQLRLAIDKAIALWETEAGKPLFQYSESGFPIELTYDERHQRRVARHSEVDTVELLRGRSEAASGQYTAAETDFRTRANSYRTSLDAHNRRVEQANAAGGAQEVDMANFQSESSRLDAERASLEQKEKDLEALRLEANRLVDELNAEVARYNQAAQTHNAKSQSAPPEVLGECHFTQVMTRNQKSITINGISIYSFHNEKHLAVVLAHELGHAIGVGHVAGDDSLMSAVESGSRIPTEPCPIMIGPP